MLPFSTAVGVSHQRPPRAQELARRSADQDRVKLIQECADLQVPHGLGLGSAPWVWGGSTPDDSSHVLTSPWQFLKDSVCWEAY